MKSSHLLHNQRERLLSILRDLRHDPERPLREGWAVAEGQTAVQNLITSQRVIGGIVSGGATTVDDEVVDVHLSKSQLDELLGFELRSPVIAVAPATDVELVAIRYPVLALDGVNDASNVGAIMRTAAVLGVATVVRCRRSANPYVRRAVRTSMGMCFHLDTAIADDLASWLTAARDEGRIVVALETGQSSIDVRRSVHADVVVAGNEGQGITPAVLRASSAVAQIPMAMPGGSFNVSQAVAIGVWELVARHRNSNEL